MIPKDLSIKCNLIILVNGIKPVSDCALKSENKNWNLIHQDEGISALTLFRLVQSLIFNM